MVCIDISTGIVNYKFLLKIHMGKCVIKFHFKPNLKLKYTN